MTRRSVMAPVSTAASGNTSWMLNTSGARRSELASPAGETERERRRHRDHRVDAPNQPPARRPARPASSDEPDERRALGASRLRLSSPGNGCTRVIDPHRVRSRADQPAAPARLDRVVAVPGQRGDDVHLVAERRQLVRRCGVITSPGRRGVGLEVGAQHDDAHAERRASGGYGVRPERRRRTRCRGEVR